MKKLKALALALVCILVLVGCSENHDSNLNNTDMPSVSHSEDENLKNNSQSIEYEDDNLDSTEDIDRSETYWVSGSTVNFRKTPSTNGEIISKLSKGTEVVKISQEGDWLYICYGGTNGYIHREYVSSYLPYDSANGEVSIVVKKSERLLELWQGGGLVDSFSIGLGWEPEGHKQIEGDGKTPEGEYYVCVRNSNSSFYLSLGVSYPNKEDATTALEDGRIDRVTYERIVRAIDNGQCPDWNTALGGAIMIHGCGGSSDWTAGCVAVDNEVMDMLFDYCPIGTKITILP